MVPDLVPEENWKIPCWMNSGHPITKVSRSGIFKEPHSPEMVIRRISLNSWKSRTRICQVCAVSSILHLTKVKLTHFPRGKRASIILYEKLPSSLSIIRPHTLT